ncbi:MAG: multicopper oxidase domain-containing protein [Proteobacteria bacterium]|nr:multicopper oxidase domain-containing protein [Pseudomonadota bacterium]
MASVGERLILNAPAAVIDPKTHHLNLEIAYVKAKIYNPASGRFDEVDIRTYTSPRLRLMSAVPSGIVDLTPSPFIAPTIEAKPGDKIKITLHNGLAPQPDCYPHGMWMNTPHCFNSTNLHTHGLWVSPEDPGDNVLLDLKPGETHEYEYDIPADHPGGTLWYHPHHHGSTALQVGGGASGALIIRGTRKPTMSRNGEIDTLFAPAAMNERILVLQQIPYACFPGKQGPVDEDQSDYYPTIKRNTDGTWKCDPGDIGIIKGYAQLGFDPTLKGEKWSGSGRFTTINGETLPAFEGATVGRIERWRMIDAGLANTISLVVRELAPGAPSPDKLTAKQNAEWVKKYCTGAAVHQFAYAADGLTRGDIVDRDVTKPSVFQPGYRQDVLMAFPHAGTYCAIDAAAEARASLTLLETEPQLLGLVRVKGKGTIVDQAAYVRDRLVAAAKAARYDAATTRAVIADLMAGLKLTRFVPHRSLMDIPEADLGHQEVAFNIGTNSHVPPGKTGFMVGEKISDPADDRPYDPNEWRLLKLGATDEWTLTSRAASHPFHIHVNPFQIVSIKDPNGKEVSVTGEDGDMQYANLQGTWKDTLFVKQNYTILIRTHYDRFWGRFVMHCHILDHEDQGMMENIEIVRPGEKPLSDGKSAMPEMQM